MAVPYLLIAGAGTDESDELIKTAEKLAPGRVKILLDLPRDQMPDFYRSLDVFVLTSLFEMMPIALLEAMASGVPVVLNDHPVLRWIVGDENGLAQSSQRTPRKENTGQIPELSESGRNFSPGLRREIEMKEQTLQQSFQHAAGQATDNGRLTTNDASAGACIDMSKEGELARFLNGITPAWIEEHGRNARERVERMFSKEAVIPQILEMYAAVAEEDADRKKY